MSKMLMGQINHARDRVSQLKAEKLGPEPARAVYKGASTLKEELRSHTVKELSAAVIKRGWEDYLAGKNLTLVTEISGKYSNGYVSTYKLEKKAPSSVEDAIAAVLYLKVNTQTFDRWEQEKELFNLRQEALNLKAQTVEDAIVLGDQQAALHALNEFAAFEL